MAYALLLLTAWLPAYAADFTGPAACAECHPNQYRTQSASHHAHALRPIDETPLAELLTREPIRDRTGTTYEYRKAPGGVEVSITKGAESAKMLLGWAFGAGAKGYTPVGRAGGEYIEHRVSWYRENGRLGLTPGHTPSAPPDLFSALGVRQSRETISRCFDCHATGVEPGPNLDRMQQGVTCERCHGPGAGHIAAARAKKPLANTIFNSHRLPARAQVQVCAQCHRLPNAEFPSSMPELDDPVSIRFAPVGFQASVCFQKSKTFSCVTCHNPHEDPRPASDPSYTQVCLGCHVDKPKPASSCKRALKANCVACHLKTATPLPNLTFTDHRIRVYPD